MPEDSDEVNERVRQVEERAGHPGVIWASLQAKVQDEAITRFDAVYDDWLALLWSLDQYRVAGVPPAGMGNVAKEPGDRLAAVYRGKGNWFASLLTLLLENQTSHRLAPRVNVQGFSQLHQIDVAWPDRGTEILEDPLVCLETKVTGAPPAGSRPARGAMSDWSNRRKELKFQATDLKLYRRQQETQIRHWDVWRTKEMPRTYFLWAARMGARDKIEKMVREAQALVQTYLDGAGIIAWRDNKAGNGYEIVPIPYSDRVSTVDDVLYRMASEIQEIAPAGSEPPPPQRPSQRALDPGGLLPDKLRPDD